MHVLLVEDDTEAATYISKGLEEVGHVVDLAADGADGLHLALTGQYDVLIIDRMLPVRDGLSIIKMLRADDDQTPIIILSGLAEVGDRVDGLRAGGDDYLVKPFAFSELLARIDALSRRQQPNLSVTDKLTIADLELDLITHKVTRCNKLIQLQPKELKLLEYFLRHIDQVITRTMLLENVWDLHFDPQTNVVDTQISRLRNKIDKGFERPLLHTLRGTGYRLSETP